MKKKTSWCVIVFLIFLGGITFYALPASAAPELDVYLHGESFTWKEFDGRPVVKETGPMAGVGGSAKWDINSLTLKIKGEFFGGRVNYDGSTTGSSTRLDVESDTDYIGLTVEGTAGWRFPLGENTSIEPFAGPAVKYWNRVIQSTTIENINIVETEEYWLVLYAPLGIRGTHYISDALSIFAEGGGQDSSLQ